MMFKKVFAAVFLSVVMVVLASCQSGSGGTGYFYSKSFSDISTWGSMVTPGGGEGSVTKGDNVAIVKAAPDGWGGIQSEKITLDLSKEPVIMIQVRECADEYKWGAKFVPSNPVVDDHAWGFYLIEDNNFKWNNYAATDIKAKLGQDFIDLYGEKVEGVIWLYPAGSPEAVVEVTSIKMFNQK